VALVAAFEGNRLVLPWDFQPDAAAMTALAGAPRSRMAQCRLRSIRRVACSTHASRERVT
jgi:hypothetical protein